MLVSQQPLRFAKDFRWALIRELKGTDEASVADTSTPSAIALIDRLLRPGPDPCLNRGETASLTAFDRDRVLAAVLKQILGPRVESTVSCEHVKSSCRGSPWVVVCVVRLIVLSVTVSGPTLQQGLWPANVGSQVAVAGAFVTTMKLATAARSDPLVFEAFNETS